MEKINEEIRRLRETRSNVADIYDISEENADQQRMFLSAKKPKQLGEVETISERYVRDKTFDIDTAKNQLKTMEVPVKVKKTKKQEVEKKKKVIKQHIEQKQTRDKEEQANQSIMDRISPYTVTFLACVVLLIMINSEYHKYY